MAEHILQQEGETYNVTSKSKLLQDNIFMGFTVVS